MLLLLEGVDGSGKTTFVRTLQAAWKVIKPRAPFVILHRGPPKNHPLLEYEWNDVESTGTRTLVRLAEALVVADRWHWGELVYGPVFRGRSQLTWAAKWHIDAYLASRGAGMVLLDPPYNVVHERLSARGDDMVKPTQLKQLMNGYRAVRAHGSERCMLPLWVTPDNDAAAAVQAITSLSVQFTSCPLPTAASYVGSRSPEFVLVGDTVRSPSRGTINPDRPHLSAFVPYPGTSGEYMISALLEHSDTFTCRSGLINVNDEPPEVFADTINQLGNPPLLALGRRADATLTRRGYKHGSVPHPQSIRRFNNSRAADYARLIVVTARTQKDMSKWPK